MDPLSIVGTTVSLTAVVARVARDIEQFTRQVRDARKEMGDISRELGSLKSALEMLTEDLQVSGAVAPSSLLDILQECQTVIERLDGTLKKYDKDRLSARIKYVWSGKETITSYKSTLSAHRAALDLVIDIMTLSLSRQIKTAVDETYQNTVGTQVTTHEIKSDTERILEDIDCCVANQTARAGFRSWGRPHQ
jgi:chromosome segregation ATPase